jgi:hypothetical protein
MYYNCDKKTCWEQIANLIEKYGTLTNKVVYRGQGKKDKTIKNTSPFVSTTPKKEMADLFVERDWSLQEEKQRVGHLFKIHLKHALCLCTRDVHYTFSKEVKEELRKINRNRPIEKGGETYTFDKFYPRIKKLIEELVFQSEVQNGAEILVLTGGTFYKDSNMTTKGFSPIGATDYETWYSTSKRNKTRKR